MPTLKLVCPNTEWLEHDGSGSGGQNPKGILSDDILLDGTVIKKGGLVMYVPCSMGRMTELWCPDAEEFQPERWRKRGVYSPLHPPSKFTAFQVRRHTSFFISASTIYYDMKSLEGHLKSTLQFWNMTIAVSVPHTSQCDWINRLHPKSIAKRHSYRCHGQKSGYSAAFPTKDSDHLSARLWLQKYIGLNISANNESSLRHGQDSLFPFHGLHGWVDVCGCRRGHGYPLARTRPTCKWRWPPQSCAASSNCKLRKAILWSTAWWQS